MKKNLSRIIFAAVISLMTATIGFAQDDSRVRSAAGDLYLISAKAGGVNYVDGKVTVQRAGGDGGYLVKGDNLQVGDKVTTTADGRAEVLLNPGSFIRLDNDSEFEFVTTSLDDLELQINRGSAIFEVYASDDFKVTIKTPKAKFYLVDTGVYRVNVTEDGIGTIEVRRGKAQVGNINADTLKKGKTATMNGNEVSVSSFDRGDEDAFEQWSEDRAKLIAKANKKLSRDRLNNTLLSRRDGYDCFNSLGMWVYSRRYNSFSFLPFGYGWRSPYGFSFGTSTEICNYPYYYDRWRPVYRIPRSGGNGNGDGNGNPTDTPPQANIDRANRNRMPRYRQMENNGNVEVRRQGRRVNPNSFPDTGNSTGFPRSNRNTNPTTRTTPSTDSPQRSPQRSPGRANPKKID